MHHWRKIDLLMLAIVLACVAGAIVYARGI